MNTKRSLLLQSVPWILISGFLVVIPILVSWKYLQKVELIFEDCSSLIKKEENTVLEKAKVKSCDSLSSLEKAKIYSDISKSIPGFLTLAFGMASGAIAYFSYQQGLKKDEFDRYSSLTSLVIESLASQSQETRIAGLYQLEKVNEYFFESEKTFLFCVNTLLFAISNEIGRQKDRSEKEKMSKTAEIGTALNILFRLKPSQKYNKKNIYLDLIGAELHSVNIECNPDSGFSYTINMSGANFENVSISGEFFQLLENLGDFNPLTDEGSKILRNKAKIKNSDLSQASLDNVHLICTTIENCKLPSGTSEKKLAIKNLKLRYCELNNLYFHFLKFSDLQLFSCELHQITSLSSSFKSSKSNKGLQRFVQRFDTIARAFNLNVLHEALSSRLFLLFLYQLVPQDAVYESSLRYLTVRGLRLLKTEFKNVSICSDSSTEAKSNFQEISEITMQDVSFSGCEISNLCISLRLNLDTITFESNSFKDIAFINEEILSNHTESVNIRMVKKDFMSSQKVLEEVAFIESNSDLKEYFNDCGYDDSSQYEELAYQQFLEDTAESLRASISASNVTLADSSFYLFNKKLAKYEAVSQKLIVKKLSESENSVGKYCRKLEFTYNIDIRSDEIRAILTVIRDQSPQATEIAATAPTHPKS